MPKPTQTHITILGEPGEFVVDQAAKAGISPAQWIENLISLNRKAFSDLAVILKLSKIIELSKITELTEIVELSKIIAAAHGGSMVGPTPGSESDDH